MRKQLVLLLYRWGDQNNTFSLLAKYRDVKIIVRITWIYQVWFEYLELLRGAKETLFGEKSLKGDRLED